MTLLEAETLAAAYVAANIPARAFSPPDRPGYAVLVRPPGQDALTLYENPLLAQVAVNVPAAFLSLPAETGDDEAADPTLVLSAGDAAPGFGLPDPGGDPEAPTTEGAIDALVRRGDRSRQD